MVMKRKNMMARNLEKTIRSSLGRYIAILAIVALGAGLFCGLRVTKVDMIATVQRYTDDQNMFDLQVMNSYGWTQDNVDALSRIPGIESAEGCISLDALISFGGGDDSAFKLISIPEQVNKVELTAGRMPAAPDECVLDGYFFSKSMIGQEIHISQANSQGTLDNLAYDTYLVVGLVNTPLYLNMQRGSTTIGSGSPTSFLYIPRDGFSLEYYTEINMTLKGHHEVYSDDYSNALDDMVEYLDYEAQEEADIRFSQVIAEAEEAWAEGRQEYFEGVAAYSKEKQDALQELAEAEQKLVDSQTEIDESRLLLADGRKELEKAQAEVDKNRADLVSARSALDKAKRDAYAQLNAAKAELDKNYEQVAPAYEQLCDGIAQLEDGLAQIDNGIAQIDDGLAQINDGLTQIADGIEQIDDGMVQLEMLLLLLDEAADSAQRMLDFFESIGLSDSEEIAELIATLEEIAYQRDEYHRQKDELVVTRAELVAQQEALKAQKAELETTRADLIAQREPVAAQYEELLPTKATLDDAMAQINAGYDQYYAGKAEADAQFASAEAQIADGERQLAEGQALLDEKWQELLDGEQALADGEKELADGRAEYEKGRATALAEFA